MGHVNVQLKLKNLYDAKRAEKDELPNDEVRQDETVNENTIGTHATRINVLANDVARFKV